jgi:hypothetical protein
MGFLHYSTIIDGNLKNAGGSNQATGDYSATAQKFFLAPGVNEAYLLTGFYINLVVAGEFSANGYGDGPELTNGVKATIEDSSGTVLYDFLGGGTVKSNADWGRLVEFDTFIDKKTDDAHLTGETFFLVTYGEPLKIFGNNDERFVLTFQDDFSVVGATNPMLEHNFALVGKKENL